MATTGVGFRWLDILEKEFDKACVELDTSLAELETEEPEVVFGARQKIATLGSCFAQLTHKALTIFQNSAKMEAELVDMRAELVQARAASPGGMQDCGDAAGNVPDAARARAEAAQLARENAALRETVLALHSELFGARLATKYLDKELAGRIQQLQLLGRDMRAELRDSLWAQVEAEILLQRHKTLVRVCRGLSPCPARPPAPAAPAAHRDLRARPRTVRVRRSPHLGLGISVTGGREHGVPILISELEAGGPAALTGELYVGDAILAINDTDLTQACHKEAVQALQSVKGDCQLCVQFIATDDDDRLSEDNYRFPLYPYDGEVFCAEPDGDGATPTAPRTPDYNHRDSDVDSGSECGVGVGVGAGAYPDYNSLNNNLAILDMDDHSIKIEARLEPVVQMESPAGSPVPVGGGGVTLAGGYMSVRSASGSLSGSACNSAGCTPVHRAGGSGGGGGGGGARRRPDWRARGTYAPIMQPHDSDTPESPPPADDTPSSKPQAPTTPALPEPVPEPDLVLDRYQDSKALIAALIYSKKAGVRRDSKGFRIGSARRVTNHQPNSNHPPITANHQLITANHQPITANHQSNTANHQPITSNHQSNTANHQPIISNHESNTANHQSITSNHQSNTANHQTITANHYITSNRQPITNGISEKHSSVDKHVPLLLPGHGDPDFGTPV